MFCALSVYHNPTVSDIYCILNLHLKPCVEVCHQCTFRTGVRNVGGVFFVSTILTALCFPVLSSGVPECQFISVSLTSLNSKGKAHCNPAGLCVTETDTCYREGRKPFVLGTCPSLRPGKNGWERKKRRGKKCARSKPYQCNLAGELADP